jgi:hypothetical protein
MKNSILIAFLTAFLAINIANAAGPANGSGDGPAPNAGDGISDGSGFDKGADRDDKGAPNSGDGIPDGSGF